MKIAIILCYFGNLNANGYFREFLTSCKGNRGVTFFIVTDDTTEYSYPDNVQVTRLSFHALREKLQALYDFPISLESPYKLCDFKVAYGELFADELGSYDYWGYMDNDVVWGDLRAFLTDEVLEAYDKLYTLGHLTLFRNVPEITSLYRNRLESGYNTDFKRAFSAPDIFAIDEWGRDGGINRIFRTAGKMVYNAYDFDDVSFFHTAFRPEQKRHNPPYYEIRKSLYAYDGCKLWRIANSYGEIWPEEVAYTHFQKRSLANTLEGAHDRFLIVPDRFIPYHEPEIADFEKMAADKPLYKKMFDRRLRRVMSRLSRK